MHSRAITSLQQIQNNTTRRALLGHKNVDVKSTDALSPPPFLLHPFPCFPLPQTWFHPHHFHSSLSLPFLPPALSFPSLEIQLRHLAECGNTTVERNFDRLQRVQNIHAKDACQALQTASASDLWWLLHWLPIRQCIVYKTSLLTYKILMSGHPQLLMPINWVLWTRMEPATVIISSSVTAPVENSDLHHVWNSLKQHSKGMDSVNSFKARLKSGLSGGIRRCWCDLWSLERLIHLCNLWCRTNISHIALAVSFPVTVGGCVLADASFSFHKVTAHGAQQIS